MPLKLHAANHRTHGHHPIEDGLLDDIYRGFRISVRQVDGAWIAKLWTTRGAVSPLTARASAEEGSDVCLRRAQAAIDRYLDYVGPAVR